MYYRISYDYVVRNEHGKPEMFLGYSTTTFKLNDGIELDSVVERIAKEGIEKHGRIENLLVEKYHPDLGE